MTQSYEIAAAFLSALGAANEPCNFRAIHDKDKSVPAIKRHGSLEQHWNELCEWNNKGYGIFVTVAGMDGSGYDAAGMPIKNAETGKTDAGDRLDNVAAIRAHYVDLDNLSAMEDLQRAAAHYPPPQFWVQSSPNKAHVYWVLDHSERYRDNAWFSLHQAKLAQLFSGDPRITDPTRVMRLPGTYHLKGSPHLIQCATLPGWGYATPLGALAASLAGVNVIAHGGGTRRPLGDPELAAPGLDWCDLAFRLADPNDMGRDEWIAFTAAIKQAMWSLLSPDEAFARWSEWCKRYAANDEGENLKQWNDLQETQVGWRWIEHQFPQIIAYRKFGIPSDRQLGSQVQSAPVNGSSPVSPMPQTTTILGDFLTAEDQAIWFKGCQFIVNLGEIYCEETGRFMGAGTFNATYGGKLFVLDDFGKTTDEAWKAVTRGRLFNVPKLDHIRFLPDKEYGAIIVDDLGRKGVNIYKKPVRALAEGDITPFLRHMELMLPNEADRHILYSYFAHNAKFPGVKIPWAPFIQSAEGVGKGVIKTVMQTAVGRPYFYSPNAKELIESGSKFNAWMRAKLFILVDEIKVDERRDMIEVLKPMISEEEIEIQAKGQDQAIEDNFANWGFFSNYQNAIPITRNQRRFAPFFSVIQTSDDLVQRGMGEEYFTWLYDWLRRHGGAEMVVSWLLRYPINRGALPMRAPVTSSTEAAIEKSRGPVERLIVEAIEDGKPGFRGGWASSVMIEKMLKDRGMRPTSKIALDEMMNNIGYHYIGRSPREYFNESGQKPYLYHKQQGADMNQYGSIQGWP